MNNTISDRLISNELYESLPAEVRRKLDQFRITTVVPARTKLLTRGLAPESVFFIDRGSVEIAVPGDDRAVSVAVAGPGKVFGLRAAVSGALAEVNVTCCE